MKSVGHSVYKYFNPYYALGRIWVKMKRNDEKKNHRLVGESMMSLLRPERFFFSHLIMRGTGKLSAPDNLPVPNDN